MLGRVKMFDRVRSVRVDLQILFRITVPAFFDWYRQIQFPTVSQILSKDLST